MFLYETHMHTNTVSACAVSTPAEQVFAYKQRGYTGIIVTDHFLNGNAINPGGTSWSNKIEFFIKGYELAKKHGDQIGLDVFFGWEYTIHGSDFLTYGLTSDFLLKHPELMNSIPIKDYSRLVHDAGGFLAQAHPFRRDFWVKSPFPVSSSFIDAIEVYNGGMPPQINKLAHDHAQSHKMPMIAGTDSHSSELSLTGGIKLRNKAKSIHGLIDAIKNKKSELFLPQRGGAGLCGLMKEKGLLHKFAQ